MTRMTQNYQLLTSLYRENWIVQNIIATIPNDIMRKWYTIKSAVGPDYIDRMTRLERKRRSERNCFWEGTGETIRWAAGLF